MKTDKLAEEILKEHNCSRMTVFYDKYGNQHDGDCIIDMMQAYHEAKMKEITDEDIEKSVPYPNPISQHQADISIGWIRALKAMRDGKIKSRYNLD